MTDTPIPYLRYDTVVVNKDGTLAEWFVNAWNAMVDRLGGESFNGFLGIINGATQVQEQLAAEAAARIAGDAASVAANDGSGASNTQPFSGVSNSAAWATIGTVTVTPGGPPGNYTITITPDEYQGGVLDDAGDLSTSFTGSWRVIEEVVGGGTEYVLDSGALVYNYVAVYSGASLISTYYTVEFTGLPSGLIAANNALQSDIRLEIQRTSGTNNITAPGISGVMSVVWTA